MLPLSFYYCGPYWRYDTYGYYSMSYPHGNFGEAATIYANPNGGGFSCYSGWFYLGSTNKQD